MIKINENKLCEKCFAVLPDSNECDCGYNLNRNDSLSAGFIINGRYIIGRELRRSVFMHKYLAYDAVKNNIVTIKEFFPETFVSRDVSGAINLKNEDELASYNYLMQKFIWIMNLSQKADEEICIKAKEVFYSNNTVYFVEKNLSAVSLSDCIKKDCDFNDKEAINAIHRLLSILELSDYPGNTICDSTVLVLEDKSVVFDGFDLTDNDYKKIITDSVVSGQNLNYLPVKSFIEENTEKYVNLFSIGAVAYTMLTKKTPGSPFEEERFDFTLLNSVSEDADLTRLIQKMCSEDNDIKYELLIKEINTVFKKYGLPECLPSDSNKITHFKKRRFIKKHHNFRKM
ncbi:MAG: hypothetical protein ACLUFN_08475 [Eubacterium sp.]